MNRTPAMKASARPPLCIAQDRGAKLGVIVEPGVVGRAAEQSHELESLLGGAAACGGCYYPLTRRSAATASEDKG